MDKVENNAEIEISLKIQDYTSYFLIITPGIHTEVHCLLIYKVIKAHRITTQMSNIRVNIYLHRLLSSVAMTESYFFLFPDYQ